MMDEDYFLTSSDESHILKIPSIDCKKHGKQTEYFKLGHRHFCPHCVGDHLEKTIGLAVVK